jgi:excinuclease ABC subunit C
MPDPSRVTAMPTDFTDKLASVPTTPGVYLMKDARGRILYVGKAVVLRNRVRSYFQDGAARTEWVCRMVEAVRGFDCIATNTEKEALILEGNLIKMHRPRFNIRFKDDKQYPYLKITVQEAWPRLVEVRTPKNDGSLYFGPYANTRAMRHTVGFAKRLFGIAAGALVADTRWRGCKWRDQRKPLARPCLEYDIGRCTAPCVGYIEREAYLQAVQQTREFLEGKHEGIARRLEQGMAAAAGALDFETAARLRDQLEALNEVLEKQRMVSLDNEDQDVLALALSDGVACVEMLLIRGGKLLGDQHFMLESTAGREVTEILEAFLKQHYEAASHLPKEVLLPTLTPDMDLIGEWLSDKRAALDQPGGSKVTVAAPSRGRKRKLVELAIQNADLALREFREQEDTQRRLAEQVLADLQAKLALPRPPRRIECYDISNVQGRNAVGSMVVFEEAQPAKSQYRRFKIRLTEERPDDYEMMREVLRRRLTRAAKDEKFAKLPDLLLVDGGKGQLGCAVEVLAELNLTDLPAAGIAKEQELIFRPGNPAPIVLPVNSPSLHLLQRLRDEAHRFALDYHRSRRAGAAVESVLDQIPGIGKARRSKLLKHFGSLKRIKEASVEELAAAPGMTRPAAEAVAEFLQRE